MKLLILVLGAMFAVTAFSETGSIKNNTAKIDS
jgi:hypothetical protein